MEIPDDKMLDYLNTARQTYSDNWIKSSRTYKKLGYYDWCLNSIKGKTKVLEIGCGVGYSTIEIIKNEHIVVAIEENPDMLDVAEKKLAALNIEYNSIRRENISSANGKYHVDYKDIDYQDNNSKNLLVEGNILTDSKLIDWLIKCPPFDAIICWFMGVQSAIVKNDTIQNNLGLFVYEPMIYRQSVHASLFKIGDIILKSGGIISFIDRTQLFENVQQKTGTLEMYKQVYETLAPSINVCYIDQLEIDDPSKIEGVSIKMTKNYKVVEKPGAKFALTSTIGIKK